MGAILPPPPPPVLDIWPVGMWRTSDREAVGTVAAPLNELRAHPLLLSLGRSFDRIGIEVTTVGAAGAVQRLGIWEHDPAVDGPGALLLDAGTIDGTTLGAKEIVIALTRPASIIWLGAVPQVATSTVRGYNTSLPIYAVSIGSTSQTAPSAVAPATHATQAGVAGALPNPFVVGSRVLGGPRLQLRRSA